MRSRGLRLGAAAGAVALACAAQARAEEAAPPLTLELVETVDVWRNTAGGVAVGDTTLNKLQVSATLDGERLGKPGLRARVQVFKTNGETLSGSRTGDIQTASNIEAVSAVRLMEAWVERGFGDRALLRAGLMDLNADFDAIEPAALFLNSSHGIGPDVSQTGGNGPSIFPVSALGVHVAWSPSAELTLKAAVFDGLAGDPVRPKAFAAVNLSGRDGALVIAQADWKPSEAAQVSLGAWGYTAHFDRIEPGRPRRHGQGGAFASVQVALGGGWSGWLRAGFADATVNPIGAYFGGGLVRSDPFGRKGDRLGLAVAHAALGAPIRRRDGLPAAETALEATYQWQATRFLALQPDVQFIRHPAGGAHLPDAVAVGIRIILAIEHPT